jgi:hypothetical protein
VDEKTTGLRSEGMTLPRDFRTFVDAQHWTHTKTMPERPLRGDYSAAKTKPAILSAASSCIAGMACE